MNKCEHCGRPTDNLYICLICILYAAGCISPPDPPPATSELKEYLDIARGNPVRLNVVVGVGAGKDLTK